MLNSLLVKSIIKKDIESGEITGDTSKKMDKENPSGTGSFSMNRKADTEVGANSTTEGTENVASGENSHAEGKMNTSSGNSSHAEGWNSKASGAQAHAEGSSTASGKNSHSEGTATKATSEASHAEGYYTIAGGGSAHAEGNNSSASGNNSHAEGYYAHAEGASSHSEGQYTYSEGTASHSEGEYSKAQGIDSHAEGNRTTALGNTSHSEGSSTNNANTSRIKQDTSNDDVITYWESSKFSIAKGTSSHVEGKDCLALGDYSHSGGLATRAGYQSQTAIGEYNENKEEDIFEVGNGTSNTSRSNALELTKTGDLKIGGNYIDGSGNALSLDSANEYTDQKIADLINGAPTTLDTLKEIADAMEKNQDVVKALDKSIGAKANASDLTDHTSDTNNPHNVTKEQLGLGDIVKSEVATDFSEAETPQFQQTIDDVLDGVNELKGELYNKAILGDKNVWDESSSKNYNDLDTVPCNRIILYTNRSTYQLANAPTTNDGLFYSIARTSNNGNKQDAIIQYYSDNNKIYYRTKFGTRWTAWSYVNDVEDMSASIAQFTKIGVVGDSYASGEIVLPPDYNFIDYYNLSWGQCIARRNGITCTNYSSGGLSTRSWLTAEKGKTLLDSSEPDNLYLLALGINDAVKLGIDYLGSINDIKIDYTQNADTFYGNYGKIISIIMAKSSTAKIVMLDLANDDNSNLFNSYNTAIKEIAKHFGIPCIHENDDDFFNSTFYKNKSYGHPTATTYSGMALAIERLFSKCCVNNVAYFRDYVG